MAKTQSTPVEKAARLFDLVPYISTHQGIALSELANEFNLTESELLSDLNTLWMCGLPGYTPLELIDLEFESGYVTIRNAEVLQRVRLLTKQELVIILLGLDILSSSIDQSRQDLSLAILRLSEKIKDIVGNVAAASAIVDSTHRAAIMQAISARFDLSINYYSTIRDEITDRQITPLELSLDHGFEVLNAYCHNAKGFRTFRLDNMKTVAISQSSVNIPEEIEISDYQWHLRINARFRTSSERFRITYKARESNEPEEIVVSSFSRDWLLRNAVSTLGSVEVLQPLTARALIAQKCQSALKLYDNWALSK